MDKEKKKALVTGATGFTGTALCERLVRDGYDVFAFVRASSKYEHLDKIGVHCIENDITDKESVEQTFPDVDVVFHIAAAYRSEHADHSEFQKVNVGATQVLLDTALSRSVPRFVHCSTVGVQGEIEDPPAAEDYRFNPGDHYQDSKLDGELLALTYVDKGLAVSVVRPVGIYGPGDTRFLKLFKPISKGVFVMIGSGESLYHMTYIDDLVDGFILAATREEAVGEVFTIGGAEYTTLNVLADKVAAAIGCQRRKLRVPLTPVLWVAVVCDKVFRAVGLSPPIYPRRVEFFMLDRAFSVDKARRLLGYEPKISLDEGLRRTSEWYKANNLI
jgi:nucleoside-diphosphate-sugar epimerase